MIYGYARVSTAKQASKGNSLEEQKQALRDAGAPDENIISDQYTGTKMDRPNFSALLNKLQLGDKLIVTKLDRFARTAVDGGMIVQELRKRGVIIHILNMGLIDDTPMGKLLVKHSYSEVARLTGISRSTLTREKRRRKEGEK